MSSSKDDKDLTRVLKEANLSLARAVDTIEARAPKSSLERVGGGTAVQGNNIACDESCFTSDLTPQKAQEMASAKALKVQELARTVRAPELERLLSVSEGVKGNNIACDESCFTSDIARPVTAGASTTKPTTS